MSTRLSVFFGLSLLVWGSSLYYSHRALEPDRRKEVDFWALARYEDLRPHLDGVPEFGLVHDTDSRQAYNLRIFSAQFAAVPSILVHDFDRASLTRKLAMGYTLVFDFMSDESMESGLEVLRIWAESESVGYTVVRVRKDLAVIKSSRQP